MGFYEDENKGIHHQFFKRKSKVEETLGRKVRKGN